MVKQTVPPWEPLETEVVPGLSPCGDEGQCHIGKVHGSPNDVDVAGLYCAHCSSSSVLLNHVQRVLALIKFYLQPSHLPDLKKARADEAFACLALEQVCSSMCCCGSASLIVKGAVSCWFGGTNALLTTWISILKSKRWCVSALPHLARSVILRAVSSCQANASRCPDRTLLSSLFLATRRGLALDALGGGRIEHYPGVCQVYGYSSGFGAAPHEVAAALIKKWHPLYDSEAVTISYEGY
eukprot:1149145-Pelagomonas_calceolata.AAC.1